MSIEKYFKNKECLITYNEYLANQDSDIIGFETPQSKYIYIDLIEVKEHARGLGLGRESLTKFIDKKKEEGFNDFFLFANYDESYYENPDIEKGLFNLVRFYESLGFNAICQVNNNGDQIDMNLSI